MALARDGGVPNDGGEGVLMRHVLFTGLVLAIVASGCGGARTVGTAPPTQLPTVITPTSALVTPPGTSPRPAPTTAPPDDRPPAVVVMEPVAGANVEAAECRFAGHSEPGVALVTAGRKEVAVAADGSWSTTLVLGPGGNLVTFEATDGAGNRTVVSVPVYYEPPHGLEGMVIDTVWEQAPIYVQQYYLDDQPTGLFSGARLPVAWNDDGSEVTLWLGFAENSGTGDRGAYDTDLDVTILLLELAGYRGIWERYRVADAIDLFIPAATGFVAATCFVDGYVRHVAQLGFGPHGPTIGRLWRIDSDALELVEIAADAATCPDLSAAPIGDSATGRIVTGAGGCAEDPDACGRLLDLSVSLPRVMPLEELGGMTLGSWGYVYRYAVSVVGTLPDAGDEASTRSVWLKAFLGWDLGGNAIWRVLAETELPQAGAVEYVCWDGEGTPAVGVSGPDDLAGSVGKAWLVDLTEERFMPTDPGGIRCEIVED